MNDQFLGIVIANREYREQDALLHVLCSNGILLSIHARGIQKVKSKNASACQLFTESRFLLNYREASNIQSLRSAEIQNSYRTIREDLYRQSIAAYMCEVMDASQFEENVYPLLKTTLDILAKCEDPLYILCLFQSIINHLHGIEPYVDGCVRCGATKRIKAISTLDGGLICEGCCTSQDVIKEISQLKTFRLLCKAKLQHYEVLESLPSFDFQDFLLLYDFFAEYAGVIIRSIRFLKHLYAMNKDK